VAAQETQVKRRSVTLLLLAAAIVILAAVGGLVAWHPWSPPAAADSAQPAEPPRAFVQILKFDQDLIRSIQLITRAGTIELDDVQGAWKIMKPAELGVKKAPLGDLLYSLSNLMSERVIEEHAADLAPYGLDMPTVTVRVTLTTGEQHELYLGNMTPAGDSYYLMAKGDPRVFTVREFHGAYYQYTLRDLWEGARTPIDASYIVSLRIVKQGKPLVEIAPTEALYKSDVEFRGTTLSVVYPWASLPKPADLYFLTGFVTSLQTMQAEVAVDANPVDTARYGLDKPQYELLIRDGAGNTLHVMVGRAEANVLFLQFEKDPTVYAGDPKLLQILNVDAFSFASKNAAIVKLDNVDTLAIAAGQTRHVMEVHRAAKGSEVGAQWLIDGHSVDEKSFKDAYVAAISLQVDSYNNTPISGAADVTMTFGLNTGAGPFVVRFIPWSQEFYQVSKAGRGDILVNRQQVKVLLDLIDKLAAGAAKGS
jgi:hypothetical protein